MQPPRGTRDFGPDEMAARRALEEKLRRVFRTYNYREVQTPTFEEVELFLAKSGPGIRDEIYDFKDKSDRELALRPELTAPVMRYYFSTLKMQPKPIRLFYFGPCYRYDRPQAGRYREFWQMGCELIGDDSPEAHAELIRLALDLFEAAGLADYQLRLGHLWILRSLLEELGFPLAAQAPLMRLIDKKELNGLREALSSKASGAKLDAFMHLFEYTRLEQLRELAKAGKAKEAYDHLDRVFGALAAFGVDASKVRVDPTIARGLEYYSGLVFELDAPFLGAEKQLLGGGAYDLSAVFQQAPVACVGFALGFDRTLVALEKKGLHVGAVDGVDAYLAALDADARPTLLRAAHELRRNGHRVELESGVVALKKALQRGTTVGAKLAVFAGAQEAGRGVVAVKDLATGQQSEVAAAQVARRVDELIRAAPRSAPR
ncbi:MAG TPA: histidine--tRNA ligase [Candidatus Thermoplasmatota archaeon]|nr:histidine--tRNA ligase [Candidatus Thermoplasmatota archaeon]